ncbi:MAG: Rieske (2Fe-2S) protein [Pseudonocardiales bacterium]
MSEAGLSRRAVLRGTLVTLVGGVAGYLATRNSAAAKARRGTTAANAYGAADQSGRLLAALDKVPQDGGLIISDPPIVLTRTVTGDVHAFSAVCPHQGCKVDRVSAGKIDCPCHGSQFDVNTGDVITGPATSGLPSIPIAVREGSVYTS